MGGCTFAAVNNVRRFDTHIEQAHMTQVVRDSGVPTAVASHQQLHAKAPDQAPTGAQSRRAFTVWQHWRCSGSAG